MMNNAIQTALFMFLRSKYYTLMDSIYFVGSKYRSLSEKSFLRQQSIYNKTFDMLSTTTHTLNLLVSSIWSQNVDFLNSNVNIYTYNVSMSRGFEWLKN